MFRPAISLTCCVLIFSIDALGIVMAQRPQPSAVKCDSSARVYAQQNANEGKILGRGAAGSVIGLGLGALAAASGVGAAIGATVGVISGGAKREQRVQQIYNAAYQDCMAGRLQ